MKIGRFHIGFESKRLPATSDNSRQVGRSLVSGNDVPWTRKEDGVRRSNFLYPSLVQNSFKLNVLVFAIVSRYCNVYSQPRPKVYDPENDYAEQKDHPLWTWADGTPGLLRRPNRSQSWPEFAELVMLYRSFGNCYIHKRRDRAGIVRELVPYSDGVVTPHSGGNELVDFYRYDIRDNRTPPVDFPPEDIIHLPWLVRDPEKPWLGLSPIISVAREVDGDKELTKKINAILVNSAAGQVFNFAEKEGEQILDDQLSASKADMIERTTGNASGSLVVTRGNLSVNSFWPELRGLNITELRSGFESRVTSAFEIPAVVVGLQTGLRHMIYNNYEQARLQWYEEVLKPMWERDGGTLTRALIEEFPGYNQGFEVKFDTSQLVALYERNVSLQTTAIEAFTSGVLSRNEARAYFNGIEPDESPTGQEYASGQQQPAPEQKKTLMEKLNLRKTKQPATPEVTPEGKIVDAGE